MTNIADLLTDNLDIWTRAIERRSTAGRGRSKKFSLYGIEKLRALILDLAVRGKLVLQNTSDEPATKLVERAKAAMASQLLDGVFKIPAKLPPVIDNPSLPVNWCSTRLGQVVRVINGRAYGKSELLSSGTPVLRVGNLFTSNDWYYSNLELEPDKYIDDGDLIYAWSASFGPFIWNGGKVIYHYHIWKLEPFSESSISKNFLRLYLQNETASIKASGHGIAMLHMTKERMEKLTFGLPPLAEQHRIVAKVDELMGLCDRLEAGAYDAIAAHQLLVSELLATLTASKTAADFAQSWQRIEANFDTLFTTEDSIETLKQTILQLAVMGKLVPQDPNDEPAQAPLKKIAREKEQLVRAGEIKKEKPLEPITTDNEPFEIPGAWTWVRLDQLTHLITKGSSPKWQGVNYVGADEGILFITSENVGNYELRKLHELKYVDSRFRDIEPRSMLKYGDILMNLVGASIGRTAIFDLEVEANINQAVAIVRLIKAQEKPSIDFLLHYFNSSTAIDFMLGSRVITAQPNMSLTDVREFPIPFPPLAEQRRIVSKIDDLFAICDAIKQRLSKAQQEQLQFADAVASRAVA